MYYVNRQDYRNCFLVNYVGCIVRCAVGRTDYRDYSDFDRATHLVGLHIISLRYSNMVMRQCICRLHNNKRIAFDFNREGFIKKTARNFINKLKDN